MSLFRLTMIASFWTAVSLTAAPVVFTFEGLLDGERVLEYYNGRTGSAGSFSGLVTHVAFSAGFVALIDKDAGGSGNFAKPPSGQTVLGFAQGAPLFVDATPGFNLSGIDLFYTPPGFPLEIQLFAGPGGTGVLIQSLKLPGSRATCGVDPVDEFSCWTRFDQQLPPGVVSLAFTGWFGKALADDLVLATTSAVPEPASWGLLALGALLMTFFGIASPKRQSSSDAYEQH